MIFKAVFQIPCNENTWDEQWARELRTETPGDPHGPHIKIYANQKDVETGEKVIFIRCKHTNFEDLEKYIDKVMGKIKEIL